MWISAKTGVIYCRGNTKAGYYFRDSPNIIDYWHLYFCGTGDFLYPLPIDLIPVSYTHLAAPATANAAIPAIGAKSPVFAAFALVVVDSCPVCVPSTVLPLSVGVSAGVPSTCLLYTSRCV